MRSTEHLPAGSDRKGSTLNGVEISSVWGDFTLLERFSATDAVEDARNGYV